MIMAEESISFSKTRVSLPRFVRRMLVLNLLSLTAAVVSAYWDAVEHAKGAVDTFWYPPHYGIYFSILSAAIISGLTLLLILLLPGKLKEKIRSNAALVMLASANALSFSGAPLDVWWHQTYGFHVSQWIPPHLNVIIGSAFAALAVGVYFLDDEPVKVQIRLPRRSRITARNTLLIYCFLLSILIASYLFVEYEIGLTNSVVLGRPVWTYPVLWTGFVLFMISLIAGACRYVGMATLVTSLYVLLHLFSIGVDRALLAYGGETFFPTVLPALAFDVLILFVWFRWGVSERLAVGVSSLVVAGLVSISTPLFWNIFYPNSILIVQPWWTYWPVALAAGVVGGFCGWWCGTSMRKLGPISLVGLE